MHKASPNLTFYFTANEWIGYDSIYRLIDKSLLGDRLPNLPAASRNNRMLDLGLLLYQDDIQLSFTSACLEAEIFLTNGVFFSIF